MNIMEAYGKLVDAFNLAEETMEERIATANPYEAKGLQAELDEWNNALDSLYEYLTENGGEQ